MIKYFKQITNIVTTLFFNYTTYIKHSRGTKNLIFMIKRSLKKILLSHRDSLNFDSFQENHAGMRI